VPKHVAFMLAFVAELVFAALCIWALAWAALKGVRAIMPRPPQRDPLPKGFEAANHTESAGTAADRDPA
jgi:hypothetical protein